jgi:hypothetical protein
MDKLEEHIRKNREDLDRYNPPSSVRRRMGRELGIKKPVIRQWYSVAAMIAVIAGTAIILFGPVNRWTGKEGAESNLDRTNPQLKETEIYYNNLVNALYKEAAPMLTKNPEVRKELNSDLSHLDSICIDLKKDLKDNISNQDVVEALIQNYRIKIQILEDMLTVLKENNNNPDKKKSHEL